MSAKPGSVPTWATSTNYPAGAEPEAGSATKVALSTNQALYGWRPDKKPPAQEMNLHNNAIGAWLQYLSDGDLEGDHTIDGGGLAITGGDLSTDGAFTAGGDADLQSECTVTGGLHANGGFYHDDRERWHQAPAGCTATGGVSIGGGASKSVIVTTGNVAPIELIGPIVGDRIKQIIVTGTDFGASAPTFTVNTVDVAGGGSTPLSVASATRTGAAGGLFSYLITLTTPYILPTAETLNVECTAVGGTTSFYNIGQLFDRIP